MSVLGAFALVFATLLAIAAAYRIGFNEGQRSLRRQIEEGRQAYTIYPLVEESAKVDLKAATEMADHLSHDVFPDLRVALLHGRLKQDAKDHVMNAFGCKSGQIVGLIRRTTCF